MATSQIFARAAAIRRQLKKDCEQHAKALVPDLTDKDRYHEVYKQVYDMKLEHEMNEFEEVLRIAEKLNERYMKVIGGPSNQWYFITIRPDCSKVTFEQFYDKIKLLMDRKCFHTYTLSFEQKGCSVEDLGKGFHVHIVCDSTHKSKGQCLRDVLSSFKQWIAKEYIEEQCIDVQTSKRPKELIENYLIAYQSDDGHKEKTKTWDLMWREQNNIKPIYEGDM